MVEHTPKRNKHGDVELPKLDEDFWQKLREDQYNYVFQFQDSAGFFHPMDYDGIPDNEIAKSFPRFDLKKYKLFSMPEDENSSRREDHIHFMNTLQDLYIYYFYELFHDAAITQGYVYHFDISTIVLSEAIFEAIHSFIKKYELTNVGDFIFFLIASLQKYYVSDVEYYQSPEQQKQVKNAKKEAEKAITVLDKTDDRRKLSQRPRSRLEAISFKFNDGILTIKDSVLNSGIVSAFREHENNGSLKNWRKQLAAYPRIYDENKIKNKFGQRSARALYNFFIGTKIFPNSNGKKTAVYEAVLQILEFASIPVVGKEEDLQYRAKIIRLWIKRNEIDYAKTHYEIKPDTERLLKYFKDLPTGLSKIIPKNMYSFAYYLCDRFNLSLHINEIAYLILFASNRITQLRWEYLQLDNQKKQIPDLTAFSNLIECIQSKGKDEVLEFSFRTKSTGANTFTSPQLILIIKSALLEYNTSNKEEFTLDVWESDFIEKDENSWEVKRSNILNKPSERFLPKFCRQFYDYLLGEIQLSSADFMPSEKYILLIGLCLQKAGAFSLNMNEEEYLKNKVRGWLNLTENT